MLKVSYLSRYRRFKNETCQTMIYLDSAGHYRDKSREKTAKSRIPIVNCHIQCKNNNRLYKVRVMCELQSAKARLPKARCKPRAMQKNFGSTPIPFWKLLGSPSPSLCKNAFSSFSVKTFQKLKLSNYFINQNELDFCIWIGVAIC